MDFFNSDEPNFIFNNINALIDFGCIIESEIPDIKAKPRIEEISIVGRSGTLQEWYGDYETYDLSIGNVTIPYENLEEVKRWLTGGGKLITHNDSDKFIQATPTFSEPLEFRNEWGLFYSFDLTFRCQPFKRKINEQFILINSGMNIMINEGIEKSFPIFELGVRSETVVIRCNDSELKILNLKNGLLTIDCELGLISQDNLQKNSIGDWPEIIPGQNKISIIGDYYSAKIWLRSVWL